jgi:hypothetical protein
LQADPVILYFVCQKHGVYDKEGNRSDDNIAAINKRLLDLITHMTIDFYYKYNEQGKYTVFDIKKDHQE